MDNVERQKEREQEYITKKANKVLKEIEKKKKEGKEHDTSYGEKAMFVIAGAVEEEIVRKIERPLTGCRFVKEELRPVHNRELDQKVDEEELTVKWLSATVAAYLVHSMSSEPTVINLARELSDMYCLRMNIEFYDKDDEECKEFQKRMMRFFVDIINFICEHESNIFCQDDKFQPELENKAKTLMLQPEWKELIEKVNDKLVSNSTMFVPMLEKPLPHKNLVSGEGGCFTIPTPLLKRPGRVKGYVHPGILEFKVGLDEESDSFFSFVNRKQETQFAINVPFLDVILDAQSRGLYVPKFPNKTKYVKKEYDKKADIKIREINKAMKRNFDKGMKKGKKLKDGEVLKECMSIQSENKIKSEYRRYCSVDVSNNNEIVELAKLYRNDVFYYNVYIDDRGRFYPYVHSGSLSYIGGALAKGFICFGRKRVINEKGLNSLFDTLGNALGFDKKSIKQKRALAIEFYERYKRRFEIMNFDLFFLKDESQYETVPEEIKLHNEGVKRLDDPVNCIVVCLELVYYYRDPENYESGYIAHRDARCSGPSIVGIATQDKMLMEFTSVIDTIKWDGGSNLPDLYTYVADMMKADNKDSYFKKYEDIVFTRGAVKTQTMTHSAYGCTQSTIHKKNVEMFSDNGLDTDKSPKYTKQMMVALNKAMPICDEYLASAESAAKEVLKSGDAVYIKSKLNGLPIVFCKKQQELYRLQGTLKGKDVKLRMYVPTNKTDVAATVRAVPPGIIHHFDSWLLMEVSNSLPDIDLATIHDSIGSHPNDSEDVVKAYAQAAQKLARARPLDDVFESMGTTVKAPYSGTASEEDIDDISNSIHCLT